MTPADQVIADAVAAVITAAYADEIPDLPREDAQRAARRAVRDLRRDGWHITAHPMPHPIPETDR